MMEGNRLDQWLHLTCLYKSRSQASRDIRLGRVKVNGQKTKAHRKLNPGDMIEIARHYQTQKVKVLGFTSHNLPKKEARQLYEDLTPPLTDEEKEAIRQDRQTQRLFQSFGKPDKRTRRRLRHLKGKG